MLLAALQSCLPAATRLGTGSGGHIRKQNAGAIKGALDPSLLLQPSSNSNKTFATAASAAETATAAMSGLRSIKQVWSEKLCAFVAYNARPGMRTMPVVRNTLGMLA